LGISAIARLYSKSEPHKWPLVRYFGLAGTRTHPKIHSRLHLSAREVVASSLDEAAIQRAVCQHLDARPAPGLVWWHSPNGGFRLPVEAAIFKGLGVRPGVADLILLHEAKFHALELKAHAKSRVSLAQRQFIADVRAAGGEADIGYGLDDALRKLEAWGLLRGTTI
jgi:hypothetical protein